MEQFGGLGGVAYWRRCVIGGGLWDFKRLLPFRVSSLCLWLELETSALSSSCHHAFTLYHELNLTRWTKNPVKHSFISCFGHARSPQKQKKTWYGETAVWSRLSLWCLRTVPSECQAHSKHCKTPSSFPSPSRCNSSADSCWTCEALMPSDNNHPRGMNFSAMTQDRKNRFRGSYYRRPVVVTHL